MKGPQDRQCNVVWIATGGRKNIGRTSYSLVGGYLGKVR